MKTPDFRFHVDARKRIFEYKMSYILQRTLYAREAIVFGYNHFTVFVFMGKNDLTRLYVHLCVLFLTKSRNRKSVHFQKKKISEWVRTYLVVRNARGCKQLWARLEPRDCQT